MQGKAAGRFVAGALLVCAAATTAGSAPKFPWVKSYAAAMGQAKKTGKLVMVDFYTDW